jgi:hypothetical protein
MDRVVAPHYLCHWGIAENGMTGGDVASVAEVAAQADVVAAAYQEDGFSSYPGLTLMRGVDVPEDSLGICVAPFGWAIIHTNDEYFQEVTHSDRAPDGVKHKVWFEDILEVGTVCFLDRELAIEVIDTWMAGGGLLAAAGFSDDLFVA